MVTTPTTQAEDQEATEPFIVFHDRHMRVQPPDDAKYAILIEAERWMTRVVKEKDKLNIPDDAPADHPDVIKAIELTERSKNHLGRVLAILGSLFLDEEDWDFIRDGMAARELGREEVLALPVQIIRACRQAEEPEPANREQRRKAARGKRVT